MKQTNRIAATLGSLNDFLRIPELQLRNGGRYGNYIQTYTGKRFYPLDPRVEEIDIEDIAHALSNKCRFTGHTLQFYSVAQHSYLASFIVPPEYALEALLHDASEAYLADMAKPVKVLPEMKNFREIEDKIQRTVCERYNLPLIQSEAVHVADRTMLVTEKRDLMSSMEWTNPKFNYKEKPLISTIIGEAPTVAKAAFLRRFRELEHTQKSK